uniref:CR-type domain-containing protein n=1 Tax=Parascaris equorum TaxID=6256 RepID=A0A914R332_PAREQ
MGSKDGQSHECHSCRGRGTKIAEKDRCKTCKGEKTLPVTKTLEVHVERGMRHNQKVTFRGEADQQVASMQFILIAFVKNVRYSTISERIMDLQSTSEGASVLVFERQFRSYR